MQVLAWAVPTIVGLELSAAVGLNITLPVLVVALLARTGNAALAPGFAVLKQDWAIAILFLLASFEIVAGKHVSQPEWFKTYLAPGTVHGPAGENPIPWMGVPRLLTLPLAAATAVMLAAAIATNLGSHGPTGLGLFMVLIASAVLAFLGHLIRMWLRTEVQASNRLLFSGGEDLVSLAIALCAALAPLPSLLLAGLIALLLSRRVRELLRFPRFPVWPSRTAPVAGPGPAGGLHVVPGSPGSERFRPAGSLRRSVVDPGSKAHFSQRDEGPRFSPPRKGD